MELKCLALQLVVSAAFLLIANASECTDGDSWTAPSGWTGPEAAYYKSFENTKCMTLHNGAQLLPGRVGQGVFTNEARKQYVDLGVIADKACIVSPTNCTSGGTISAWILYSGRMRRTSYYMTSFDEPEHNPSGHGFRNMYEGFHIIKYKKTRRVATILMADDHTSAHVMYFRGHIKRSYWYHIVIVYNADTKTQDTYINGNNRYVHTKNTERDIQKNTGKLVIGRKFAVDKYKKMDNPYWNVGVDELVAFNEALTPKQVKELYHSY